MASRRLVEPLFLFCFLFFLGALGFGSASLFFRLLLWVWGLGGWVWAGAHHCLFLRHFGVFFSFAISTFIYYLLIMGFGFFSVLGVDWLVFFYYFSSFLLH